MHRHINDSLIKRIALAYCLPSFIIFVALSTAFYVSNSSRAQHNEQRLLRIVEQVISSSILNIEAVPSINTNPSINANTSINTPLAETDVERLLGDAVTPFLNSGEILSLYLISPSFDQTFKRGVPDSGPLPETTLFALAPKTAQQLTFNDSQWFSVPVHLRNRHYGWLLLQRNPYPSTLFDMRFDAAIIVTALAILLLLLTISFALYRHVSVSLFDIQDELESILKRYNKKIDRVRQPQMQSVNQRISEVRQLLDDTYQSMQDNLKKTAEELKKNLENMEIQNIELDIARKNALKDSHAKSEFLANTSHEFRTPLNGILGFTSLLFKTPLTPQQKEYLKTIEQSSQGLLTVISDVLDFSRLESGNLQLEYKPVNLRDIVEEVYSIHAASAHDKQLRLISFINHDIHTHLLGDPQRLKQVTTNLVSNAIKFSSHGNIILRASIVRESDNTLLIRISVTDNGVGLTREQQPKLFKAFPSNRQANPNSIDGRGLGLAVAKGLVESMQGEIGVNSEKNKGAEFWFTVQLGVNRDSTLSSPQLALPNCKAIIYDSDPMSRLEIAHNLKAWKASYKEISQFHQLKQLSYDQVFNIAIIDAEQNEHHFDTASLLGTIEHLNRECRLAVVVIASNSIQRILEPLLDSQNAAVVIRPISQAVLYQAVQTLMTDTSPAPFNRRATTSSGAEPLALENNKATHPTEPLDSSPNTTDNDMHISDKTQNLEPHVIDTRAIESRTTETRAIESHVLVVDDNPANVRLVCEFLKGLGVRFSTASDGIQALEQCRMQVFDLILMDVQMPRMNGLETTQCIREQEDNTKRTPIVALTAHAVNEHKAELLVAGMDDYLSKPISENELRHILARWISHYEPPTHELSAHQPSTHKTVIHEQLEPKPKTHEPNHPPMPPQGSAESTEKVPASAIFSLQESLNLAKNKADLARDMLTMLVDSLDETLEVIEQHYKTQDWKNMRDVVHKFHGGCCYCGVPGLRNTSHTLEKALEKPTDSIDPSEIKQAYTVFIDHADAFKTHIAEYDIDALFEE